METLPEFLTGKGIALATEVSRKNWSLILVVDLKMAEGSAVQAAIKNSLERFSDRVENYVKYRPSYPAAVFDLLSAHAGLSSRAVVADIGSGTGISAALLLPRAARVFAVEPNAAMRAAADELLGSDPRFQSVDGTAEATNLEFSSIDLIVAAQAFHWFDVPRAHAEFVRILKPSGQVALIWNDRKTDSTPFLRDYETFLHEFGTDYAQVNHRNVVENRSIDAFFAPHSPRRAAFLNHQDFDFEGLKGRLLSSSYVPGSGDPRQGPMLEALKRLFDRYHTDGLVRIEYSTEVFWGAV